MLLGKEYSKLGKNNTGIVLMIYSNSFGINNKKLYYSLLDDKILIRIITEDIINNDIDSFDDYEITNNAFLNKLALNIINLSNSISKRRIHKLPKKTDSFSGEFKEWYINNFYTKYCKINHLMCWSAALDSGNANAASEHLKKTVLPTSHNLLLKYRYLPLSHLLLLPLNNTLFYIILYRIVDQYVLEGKSISFRDMNAFIKFLNKPDDEIYAVTIGYPNLFKIVMDKLGKFNIYNIVKLITRDIVEGRSHSIGTQKWFDKVIETNDKYIHSDYLVSTIKGMIK